MTARQEKEERQKLGRNNTNRQDRRQREPPVKETFLPPFVRDRPPFSNESRLMEPPFPHDRSLMQEPAFVHEGRLLQEQHFGHESRLVVDPSFPHEGRPMQDMHMRFQPHGFNGPAQVILRLLNISIIVLSYA